MKRIIDGVTYNTATSTLLAESEYETDYNHVARSCEAKLYQTRGGAFFVHEIVDLGYDPEENSHDWRHRCHALSSDEAQKWIMTGDVQVHHSPFEEPPEAVAEQDAGATIYMRVPATLKTRVEAAAKTEGLSGNAWGIRCYERCLDKGHNDERRAELKRYLDTNLPTNGVGLITAERLRQTLMGVVERVASW